MMNSYANPDLQHVNDVLDQYVQSKQQQTNGGLLQQILGNRMMPQDQDIMTAGLREAQSFASPQGFRAYTPEGQMANRVSNQLSPYSDALKLANAGEVYSGNQMQNQITAQTGLPAAFASLQAQQQKNDVYGKTGLPQAMADLQISQTNAKYADPMAQAKMALEKAQAQHMLTGGVDGQGGATGVLVSRLMKADPTLTFPQALQLVQTGFRQGIQLDANGNAAPIPGMPNAKGAIKQGEQTGTEQAKLNFAAPIAQQTKIGEATGKAEGAIETRAVNAPQMETLLQEAEGLLPQATGGGIQTQRRDALAYFGSATKGSKADARLNVIGAALTANVPRMEGPQSDYDVALYSKAAGDVANSKLPTETRLAAITTIRDLNKKYATQGAGQSPNSGGFDIDSYLKEKGLQ